MATAGGELSGTEHAEGVGVDIRYLLTPSRTPDFTWNTDFAQVQAEELGST